MDDEHPRLLYRVECRVELPDLSRGRVRVRITVGLGFGSVAAQENHPRSPNMVPDMAGFVFPCFIGVSGINLRELTKACDGPC